MYLLVAKEHRTGGDPGSKFSLLTIVEDLGEAKKQQDFWEKWANPVLYYTDVRILWATEVVGMKEAK
jgi:hypothetical protein